MYFAILKAFSQGTEAATRGVLCKKVVLENFTKFTGKHLCQSLFFNKVTGLWPVVCNFIKKETLKGVKFIRTPFSQNTSGRLLLKVTIYHATKFARNLYYLLY